MVNRSELEEVAATIDIKKWSPRVGTPARIWGLNGKDRYAANNYGSPDNVNIRENTLVLEQLPLSYRFPAHSVTVLEFPGQRIALTGERFTSGVEVTPNSH